MSTPDTPADRSTRAQRLAALAEAHYQWSLRHEADTVEATPVGGDSDESVWHPAVATDPDAEDEFFAAARRILDGER